MKKSLLAVLVSAAVVLSGCSENAVETERETEIVSETAIEETTEIITSSAVQTSQTAATTVSELEAPSLDNFPVVDGSTSTIELDTYIRAAFLGIEKEEIKPSIVHTKTHESFNRLISGEADAIYTVPISENQKRQARIDQVELESVPVAREGFVFVVNAENPVDSLTEEQIRKIYSGEITNWKEVGGNDAEIHAFQRNEDSGSYNYMLDFMGKYKMCEPKERDYTFKDMDGIMYNVGNYDNGIDSIGFSVYSFATDKRFENIKFIAVNSVEPNAETLRDGTYPIASYSYFMFRADEPEDSMVRRLADFIQSEAGQDAVEKAGLIRIDGKRKNLYNDSGSLFSMKGTGHPKPENFEVPKGFYYNDDLEKITDPQDYDMINEFIREAKSELSEKIGTFTKDELPPQYSSMVGRHEEPLVVNTKISCVNQYCSVVSMLCCEYDIMDLKLAYFNLAEHRQIELSDFFYEGTDFMNDINDEFINYMENVYSFNSGSNVQNLTPECLYIDPCRTGVRIYAPYNNNPYLKNRTLELEFDTDGYDTFVNDPIWYHVPEDNYNRLAYEFAEKSVIFEGYDVSTLYSDAKYVPYKNDFYMRTFTVSKGYVMMPVKSRIMDDSQLRTLQAKITECAEEIIQRENAHFNEDHDWDLNFLIDCIYEPENHRFVLKPEVHFGFDKLNNNYYLDIDTLEFTVETVSE